jgi:hypothetical protein
MQGAPQRQVKAEEMIAELKRALESSTPAPNVPPSSALTPSKSSSAGRESWRPQIDRGSGRSVKAKADRSIGQPADLQRSTRPSSRRWKLTAAGLALAGAAAICASLVLMMRAPNPPAQEPSSPSAEGGSQNERAPDSRSPTEDSRQAAPLQAGALGTQPDRSTAPANSGSAPALGKAEVATLVPPSLGAIPVASQAIGPDGAPIATAPSTRASTDSAPPPAEAPKTAAPLAAPQTVGPHRAPIATAPSTPASTDSAPPPAETPKPGATPAAHVSNESARPATPKVDSPKRPARKASLKKPARSAKVSAKPAARVERPSTAPAQPKEAESSPQPAQETVNPAAAAPVTPTTIGQRFADGITHAFSYVTHLPGALVPHPADPNAGAH